MKRNKDCYAISIAISLVIYLRSEPSNKKIISQDRQHKSIHQIQYEHYKTIIPDLEAESTDYLVSLKRRYAAPTREVFGYHPYWMGTAWQNYNYNLLSTIAYFGVAVNGNGQITDYHGWPVTSLINEAHSHGVEVVLAVILFSGDQIM